MQSSYDESLDELGPSGVLPSTREHGRAAPPRSNVTDNASAAQLLEDKRRMTEHIRLLVHVLVRNEDSLHRQAIKKYFSPSAVLVHPVLGVHNGRGEIYRILRFWSRLTSLLLCTLTVTVNSVLIADDLSLATVDLTQHIVWSVWPALRMDFHMYVLLHLVSTADGLVIQKQVDEWTLLGLFKCILPFRMIWDLYGRFSRAVVVPFWVFVVDACVMLIALLRAVPSVASAEAGGFPAAVIPEDR